eukprot:TRINITY_DN91185_c0_g1_i1.p1 TRINITY_DN91185_c0_g1~~TRINITY_DN91185_c0_g1_i1.p1  ORF type:complete len:363 (-),score=61.37 TRINITY_DN91185_c0_g1_i1:333-1364(-)
MPAAQGDPPQAGSEKSSFTAYVLLLIGGPFGLHHLYLHRSTQALLWACSFGLGGFFGVGLARDVVRIPSYVSACSDGRAEQDFLEAEMKYYKQPPWSFTRLVAMLFFGSWFGLVGRCAGFDTMPSLYFHLTACLGTALGCYLVGIAATHQSGTFRSALIGSAVGMAIGQPAIGSVIGFQWKRSWKKETSKTKLSWKWMVILVPLFWSLTLFGMCQHLEFKVKGAEDTIKLKDAIYNIYSELSHIEWGEFFKDGFDFGKISDRLDASGEKNALRALGLQSFTEPGAAEYTAADVKSAYRAQAKKWHPDHAPPEQKVEYEQKMQEINGAKSLLDDLLAKRNKSGR